MEAINFIAAIIATFRLTEILGQERISDPIRKRFKTYLLNCPRCLSVWAGILATVAFFYAPFLNYPLAFSALYILQSEIRMAGFSKAGRFVRLELDGTGAIVMHHNNMDAQEAQRMIRQAAVSMNIGPRPMQQKAGGFQ